MLSAQQRPLLCWKTLESGYQAHPTQPMAGTMGNAPVVAEPEAPSVIPQEADAAPNAKRGLSSADVSPTTYVETACSNRMAHLLRALACSGSPAPGASPWKFASAMTLTRPSFCILQGCQQEDESGLSLPLSTTARGPSSHSQ